MMTKTIELTKTTKMTTVTMITMITTIGTTLWKTTISACPNRSRDKEKKFVKI